MGWITIVCVILYVGLAILFGYLDFKDDGMRRFLWVVIAPIVYAMGVIIYAYVITVSKVI